MSLDALMLSESARGSLSEAVDLYEKSIDMGATFLAARGIVREDATSYRLGYVDEPAAGHERFAGMLCIPYLTTAGPVALKFRRLDDQRPKYDGPGGQTARLFNARSCADGAAVVCILEGELDTVLGARLLGVPCVGTPGTQWHSRWTHVVRDCDRIIVVADHDVKKDGSSPGMSHALRVVEATGGELVMPPPGMDFTDWVAAEGEAAVRERIGV